MKQKLIALVAFAPLALMGQTFDFDLTRPQPVYTDGQGYGYDEIGRAHV